MNKHPVERHYREARHAYLRSGVDPDRALRALSRCSLSIHCWQADDVRGFESIPGTAAAGLSATGDHPGRCRDLTEVRTLLEGVLIMIPGRHRVNLHAMYGDFRGRAVDRNAITAGHFRSWIRWARRLGAGLDFNATCFNHPMVRDGYTLASPDPAVRRFWIEHVRRSRRIAAGIGRRLGRPCLHNLWIPDGAKDVTLGRFERRQVLARALDEIYRVRYPARRLIDSVESKLFGIGSEHYQAGSHEFYLGYALRRGLVPCLDLGHFHPTESVADKISALLVSFPGLVIHISRGLRWDSDHVPLFTDELREVMLEIVRARALDRVRLALDFFDASLDRSAAYAIGGRAALKALLWALLEPAAELRRLERRRDRAAFLALYEARQTMPFGAVWDYYCRSAGAPADRECPDR